MCANAAVEEGGEKGGGTARVTARRRLRSTVRSLPACAVDIPNELLCELRNLLRGHGMAQVVARMSKCRAAKFSGVIFERQNVTSECPDGLPKAMRALRYSSGFELVGVPPALVATAARRISLKNISAPTLCAVFERYGCDDEDARGKDVVQWREDDIAMQMEAWSDVRSVLRTETDLLRPEGVELFHESLADMLD